MPGATWTETGPRRAAARARAFLVEYAAALRLRRRAGGVPAGALFLWTRAATPNAKLVSLDSRLAGRLGSRAPFPLARGGFAEDVRMYGPLVLPGGLIDPVARQRGRGAVLARVPRRPRGRGARRRDRPGFGVGLYRVPETA